LTVEHSQKFAVVAGRMLPAMSVTWELPLSSIDSGFGVLYADIDQELPRYGETVCMDCLLEEGGAQLGRGLDLALELACEVVYDPAADKWAAVKVESLEQEAAKL
jgi:hypothetical protein